MASFRKEVDRGRTGFRIQFRLEGRRSSLWLSDPNEHRAQTTAKHIEELIHAHKAGERPEPETVRWAKKLEGKLFDKLAKLGLVEPKRGRATGEEGRLLGPFCDSYIRSRSDLASGTIDNYGHAKRLLVEKFGESALIGSITEADAERWRRWLLARPVKWDETGKVIKTMAEATVSKHIKRSKTMFAEAVKDRLLDENPFAKLRTGCEVNRDRDHFIDRKSAFQVLLGCPDHVWQLIFAFARFGGLRRCEVLAMKWSDILWDRDQIRIDSPKTGLRFCPIFPELKPFLDSAFDNAPDGTVRCVNRYHQLANLGTQLNRIIEGSGVVPWPKTFQNLRATRRTELQEHFQDHVINSWLGHSGKTAEKHYLQVTPDHWIAGTGKLTGEQINLDEADSNCGGVPGGDICTNPESSGTILPTENAVSTACDDSGLLNLELLATPLGLEPRMSEPKSDVLPITPWGSAGLSGRSLA